MREHNEDNFVVANLTTGDVHPRDEVVEDEVGARGLMFAVCDGMGGAAAGEVASQMAVEILVEAMTRSRAPADRDALARRLVRTVEEAGRRIFESAQKERSRRGMGTTATVAVLMDKVLFLAEVGDSRAYLLRGEELKQLTKDQSLVNQLIEAGHLTEDEAEAFEHSNIILQALGTSASVQVDLTFVELRKGDRLMLCSDGLSGLVHADGLAQTMIEVEDPAECCAKLIEYAEAGGGHDNITVTVTDFFGDLKEPGEGDSFGYMQYPLPLEDDESSAFVDEDTTAAGRESGDEEEEDEHSSPTMPAPDEARFDSYFPDTDEDGDTRANVMWLLIGAVSLVLAAAVWFMLEPAEPPSDALGPEVVEPRAAAGAVPEVVEPKPVQVNVHTDVMNGVLVVNGDAKGELSTEQSLSLQLRPGAYRFEARSDGSQVAVTVVTVRGDTPMDVFLQLPEGTEQVAPGEESPEEEAPGEEPPGAEAAGEEPGSAEDGAEEPAEADGDEPPGTDTEAAAPEPAPVEKAPRPKRRKVSKRKAAPKAAAPRAPAPAAPAPAPAAPAGPRSCASSASGTCTECRHS